MIKKSTLEISITEKQILNIWISNPSLIKEEDIFITETAREFQTIFVFLKKENYELLPEHILKEAISLVTVQTLQEILDTQYQLDKLDSYYQDLFTRKKLSELSEDVEGSFGLELGSLGNDTVVLKELSEKIDGTLLAINQKQQNKYLTFYDALEKNQDYLEQLHNSTFQTSGDYLFDRLLGKQGLVASLNVLAGLSGHMKSTVCHHLFISRLVKKLPTIFINTELSFNAFMSSVIPVLMKTPYNDVTNSYFNLDEDLVDSQNVFEKYEELKYKFFERNNCYIYPNSTCSIDDIKEFILSSRKAMKLKDHQILYCFIDLLSMITDFNNATYGKNKADTIEDGVNKLNTILLDTNTFCLGTVQLRRRSDSVKKIETEEDIEKLRETYDRIKSSGAWTERSRSVLLIHNPWALVRSYPCNSLIRDLQSPILEVDLTKSNYTGNSGGRIKFFFDSVYKKIYPYVESEEDKANKEEEDD